MRRVGFCILVLFLVSLASVSSPAPVHATTKVPGVYCRDSIYICSQRTQVTTNFEIYYNTYDPYLDKTTQIVSEDSGLYDVVFNAGQYLESALSVYRKAGYYAPHQYMNGRYPVFFDSTDIPSNIYGFVQPYSSNSQYSYMVLNPALLTSWGDFRFLKVTTAHELFHAIQGKYLTGNPYVDLNNDYYSWLAEATATWAEDEVWDNIDDYVSYVPEYLDNPEQTLFNPSSRYWGDTFGTESQYKNVLYAKYLSDRYGSGVIREIWEALPKYPSNPIGAVRYVLSKKGFDLKQSFTDFVSWNYFVGNNDSIGSNDNGYSEGRQYRGTNGTVKIARSHNMTQPVSGVVTTAEGPQMFATNYLVFDIPSENSGYFNFKIDGDNGGDLDVYAFRLTRSGGVTGKKLYSLNNMNDGTISLENMQGTYRVVIAPVQFVDSQRTSSAVYQGIGYSYTASIDATISGNSSTNNSSQVSTGPYKYLWKAQNGTLSADKTAHEITTKPGEFVDMSVTLVNKSGRVIKGLSSLPVVTGKVNYGGWGLGTSKPIDNKPKWLDPSSFVINGNRFVYYNGPDVPDGGEFTLSWTIRTSPNATRGTYKMYLNCVKEWENWTQQVAANGILLKSPDIFWRVYVK